MSSERVSTWAELREKKVKRGDREADVEDVAEHRAEEDVGNEATSVAARMNMSSELEPNAGCLIAGFLNENDL